MGTIFNVRSSTPFSETSTTRNLDGSSQYVVGTSRNQGRRDLDFAAINAYRTSLTFKDAQGVVHNFPAVDASMLANGRVDTVDFRAARSFSIGEGKHVDVIGQVFNLMGTYNYSGITTSLSSLTWGQPTGAGPLQQAELAVHFVF